MVEKTVLDGDQTLGQDFQYLFRKQVAQKTTNMLGEHMKPVKQNRAFTEVPVANEIIGTAVHHIISKFIAMTSSDKSRDILCFAVNFWFSGDHKFSG